MSAFQGWLTFFLSLGGLLLFVWYGYCLWHRFNGKAHVEDRFGYWSFSLVMRYSLSVATLLILYFVLLTMFLGFIQGMNTPPS